MSLAANDVARTTTMVYRSRTSILSTIKAEEAFKPLEDGNCPLVGDK